MIKWPHFILFSDNIFSTAGCTTGVISKKDLSCIIENFNGLFLKLLKGDLLYKNNSLSIKIDHILRNWTTWKKINKA